MKNADSPATACEFNGFGQYAPEAHSGLTKREEILARFMSAMLSNSDMRYDAKGLADDAKLYVDAYFDLLERT